MDTYAPKGDAALTLLLIGFMGSGKSSVGRRLAKKLRVPFVDLDAEIEGAAGMSIPEIFSHHGEEGFRKIETQTLNLVLQRNGVIASGGGVVTRPENRALLFDAVKQRDTQIVYLRADAATLSERIRRQPGTRPLIDGQGGPLDFAATRARVDDLLSQRKNFYEECATLIVDTDHRSQDTVVGTIVKKIQSRAK